MSATFGVGDLVDGKYRIIRTIGEGGWGIVFEGENTRTLKRVAIKALRPHARLSTDVMGRFEREAQAAGRIGSEHIVEVFDLGTLADGTHYMVMELLQGEDLATRLASASKLDPIVAAKLVIQLLEGLSCAHNAGILHRDLKPENLYLVPTRSGQEFLKILDFGISKFTQNAPFNATLTGAVLGSPCYMAPEQARGLKQLDARTDLYSVGTVLFECVTGRVPFQGENFNDLMFKIVLSPRPNPAELSPGLDPRLAEIIMKSISAEPNDRFASAEQFRDTLVDWLASRGISSVRPPEPRGIRVTPLERGKGPAPARSPEAFTISRNPTLPADPGATPTPLSASSTLQASRATSRKRMLTFGGAALALLLAVTFVGLMRARGHAAPEPTAAASVPAASQLPAAQTAEPPAGAGTPAQDDSIAPVAATQDAVPTAPATPTQAPSAALSHVTPASHGTRVVRTAAAPPAASSAGQPDAKPAVVAPVPPPPKRGDTVEGREIQTGL